MAELDAGSRTLRLLTDRREALVDQRRAVANRALWRLHELDPTLAVTAVQFNYATHRDPLIRLLDNISGLVAEFAEDELREIAALTETIDSLKKRITTEIRGYAPSLLALDGCGVLTAAKIAGEVGNVTRFRNEAALARYI